MEVDQGVWSERSRFFSHLLMCSLLLDVSWFFDLIYVVFCLVLMVCCNVLASRYNGLLAFLLCVIVEG